MTLPSLVPLLTALTLSLLLPILNAVSAKSERNSVANGRFTYPVGLRVFLWVGTILWLSAPFVFVLFGTKFTIGDWAAAAVIDIFMIPCSMYADRYSVIFKDKKIIYGAFKKKVFPMIIFIILRRTCQIAEQNFVF